MSNEKTPPPADPRKTGQVARRDQPSAPSPVAPKPTVPAVPAPDYGQQMLDRMREITQGDFYKVGRKQNDKGQWEDVKEPSARVWQSWAMDQEISTKILDSGMDREKAWAHVRGWIGPEENPRIVQEEKCTVLFRVELEHLLVKAVEKGLPSPNDRTVRRTPPYDIIIDVDGSPRIVLREPADQLHVLAEWTELRRFGDRAMITKAQSRIFKKLLRGEWRDPEEIDHEANEAALVAKRNAQQGGKPEDQGGNGKPPVDTSRLDPGKKDPPQAGQSGGGKGEEKKKEPVNETALASLKTKMADVIRAGFTIPDELTADEYLLRVARGLAGRRSVLIWHLAEIEQDDARSLYQTLLDLGKGSEAALQEIDKLYVEGTKLTVGSKEKA